MERKPHKPYHPVLGNRCLYSVLSLLGLLALAVRIFFPQDGF